MKNRKHRLQITEYKTSPAVNLSCQKNKWITKCLPENNRKDLCELSSRVTANYVLVFNAWTKSVTTLMQNCDLLQSFPSNTEAY